MKTPEILSRLEKVTKTATGWKARCPAHPDNDPSLSISEGREGILLKCFKGCTFEQITAALGVKSAELFFKSNGSYSAPPKRHESVFDWQQCLAAFTAADADRLAAWRGVSAEFFKWLHAQGVLGIYEGKTAFANHGADGNVVSCHYRTESGDWFYHPKGKQTAALIFGDVAKAGFVLAFESQWDAFAVLDRLGWAAANGLPDSAVMITRGASNAKLIRDRVALDAIGYAFGQNDAPGQRWLAELASIAGCPVLNVVTPAPHKDANDWTRAGATKEQIELAMKAAKPIQEQPPRAEAKIITLDFDASAAEVRGQIISILLNDELTVAEIRNRISNLAVSWLCEIGKLYFHSERRDFDTCMFFNRQEKRLERIRSDAFGAWLSDFLQINRADQIFKYVQAAVETAALSGSETTGILPEFFWASRPDSIFLSNGDGSAAKITANGVQVVDNGSDGVLFAAGKTLQPWTLTEPRDVFETCAIFRNAHCTAGHAPDLLRQWLYSLPTNPRSKPPLCLAGDVGSGKTRTAKAFAELYGLPFVAAKVEESEESNFWPACDQGGIFTLDNADSKCRWLADALASAATDGCSQRRKLYTNSDTVTLRARAWLVVTSANPSFASDSGLADRLLLVRMSRRDEKTSDAALTDEILANRDAGLSHLADTLHKALADTGPTPASLNARHPDFAAFAVRIGRALGREAEAIAALKAAEFDKAAFCLENDAIGSALLAYLKGAHTFAGTAAELVPHLCETDTDLRERLSAKRLSKRLSALWPHLQSTLALAKREQNRTCVQVFTFKTSDAGFAGFQMPFP